jgi:hypothetical protein
MKIPLQEKIAELEGRIEALEKARGGTSVTFTHTTTQTQTTSKPLNGDSIFGEHWKKMWEEFGHVMKAAFRKENIE